MRTVWKYQAPIDDGFELRLPVGAEVLAVQVQRGVPCVWALVDPRETDTEARYFEWWGTGSEHRYAKAAHVYVGTVQLEAGALVFHLFEAIS